MARDTDERTEDATDAPVGRREFLTAAGAVAAAGVGPTIAEANETPVRNGASGSRQTVRSPDGRVTLTFALDGGRPTYCVSADGRTVVEPSSLGFEFESADPLTDGFEVTGVRRNSKDVTWEPVWGATEGVQNNYNELVVGLAETDAPGRSLTLVFRAYDDGVGFRYVLPEQENLGGFTITNERTGFAFGDDYTSWWIPDDYENYEYLYEETPLSQISRSPEEGASDRDGANTPVTMRAAEDCYLCVHEAALTDYAGMTLTRVGDSPTEFESTLVPLPDGTKVKAEAPHASPWRTITIGEEPGDLVESNLILNLNEPNRIDDTSWINPGKYMGIWWELHVGKSTWAPGPDVGATTENAKRYIDFASEHGIEGLLVEGWNLGWEGGFDEWSNPPYDNVSFTESTEHYDLEEVVAYGQEQDPPVDVVIHNETGGGVANYEDQLEEAYSYYEELGIPAAKLGYVSEDGLLFEDGTYHHHCQRTVNHYRTVTKAAAEHGIMLDIHEPIKPTGVRRTYPNLLTREGVSGLEYENFRPQGNPPSHTLIVPFTRMVGGPVDYTPGIFDLTYPEYGDTRVHDTRARQLALYPIMFSGLQMVADFPENYDDLDEFEFIENVPAAWDETTVVDGEIGRYLAMARRKGEEWFVGSGTDETPRALDVPLDFLDESERPYVATAYTDGEDADLETNPTPVEINEFVVTASDAVTASMVGGGGQAIHLRPAEASDLKDLPRYEAPDYEYDTVIAPEEATVAEPITVTVEATNPGSVIGGERLHLYVDGEPVETRFVRIPAGNEAQVEFPLRLRETGEREVAVGRAPDDRIASRTVEVTPTSDEFEWLSFDGFGLPAEVRRGETVEVTGTVTNDGGEETLQVIKMTVDDDVVRATGIDLEPGASAELTLEYAFESAGEYEVAVENLDPQTVTVPEPGATSGI